MVFLIGMPGCGKSFWGAKLAAAWGWEHVDTDKFVEEKMDMPVANIFETKGLAFFREMESKALTEIIETYPDQTIISTGGGAVTVPEIRELLFGEYCTVYLKAGKSLLLSRLQDDKTRPLFFKDADLRRTLELIFKERASFYEMATFILPAENLTLQSFQPVFQQCSELRS